MNDFVVTAELHHAIELAGRLKAADVAELRASSGQLPEEALVLSLALSPRSWAWVEGGEVVALFGVAPCPGRAGVGVPWMLTAEIARKHKVRWLRTSKPYIAEMLAAYPVLENYVDCRNTQAIQWLAWCGFALCEVEPFYGAQRLPFIRFQMARSRS